MDTNPPRLAVDAKGYVWRVYEENWSMAPSNPDNEPIPEPVTFYEPQAQKREGKTTGSTLKDLIYAYLRSRGGEGPYYMEEDPTGTERWRLPNLGGSTFIECVDWLMRHEIAERHRRADEYVSQLKALWASNE